LINVYNKRFETVPEVLYNKVLLYLLTGY